MFMFRVEAVPKNTQLSEKETEFKLKELQECLESQPEMPQKIEKLLLLRFLKVSQWRLEKAQRLIKYSIELRMENPHIFSNRDPLSDELKNVFEAVDMVPLLETTSENYKIIVFRLLSDNFDHIQFNDVIKAFFVMSDVRLITPDAEKLTDGEIPIFDMARVSYRHLTKVVLSTVRLYLRYTQEAHPVRVRQIHIINCNPIIDKIIWLIKPFVRTENFKMINFHTPGSDSLFKFIPKEKLPNEYGGSAGPIGNMKTYWMDRIENHRDYLMNDDNWRMNADENNNEIESSSILDFLGVF